MHEIPLDPTELAVVFGHRCGCFIKGLTGTGFPLAQKKLIMAIF